MNTDLLALESCTSSSASLSDSPAKALITDMLINSSKCSKSFVSAEVHAINSKIQEQENKINDFVTGTIQDDNTQSKRKLQTFKVPVSSVLSRVQNFLPAMAKANQELAQAIEKEEKRGGTKEKFSIESISDDQSQIIEMVSDLI
jgi:hypothetical protein